MRSPKAAHPGPREQVTGFGNRSTFPGGSDFHATTDALLIQRLRRRFGLTEAVAALIVGARPFRMEGAGMTLVNFPGRYRPPPKLPPDAAEDLDFVLVYPNDGLRWVAEGVAG